MIDIEPSVAAGPSWDAFRRQVIEAFQEPKFQGWDHVDLNTSIDEISSFAGMCNASIEASILLSCDCVVGLKTQVEDMKWRQNN